MNYIGQDLTVSTVRRPTDGPWTWVALDNHGHSANFEAPADAEITNLFSLGQAALDKDHQ